MAHAAIKQFLSLHDDCDQGETVLDDEGLTLFRSEDFYSIKWVPIRRADRIPMIVPVLKWIPRPCGIL